MATRLALLLGVAALAAAAPAAASAAKLRLAADLPLTVKGTAFKPREVVTVTIQTNERQWIRTARATTAGGFAVALPGVRYDPCRSSVTIVARGRKSGLVRLRVPLRECAAP